jgi:hypothetical protein
LSSVHPVALDASSSTPGRQRSRLFRSQTAAVMPSASTGTSSCGDRARASPTVTRSVVERRDPYDTTRDITVLAREPIKHATWIKVMPDAVVATADTAEAEADDDDA